VPKIFRIFTVIMTGDMEDDGLAIQRRNGGNLVCARWRRRVCLDSAFVPAPEQAMDRCRRLDLAVTSTPVKPFPGVVAQQRKVPAFRQFQHPSAGR
jgi:hypothetical protein